MKVYLITNRNSNKYDFPKLLDHFLKELPDIKREVMVRALSHTSKELVLQKKEIISNNLWFVATLSGFGGLVPIPGASVAVDIALLVNEAKEQKQILGLNDNSLQIIESKILTNNIWFLQHQNRNIVLQNSSWHASSKSRTQPMVSLSRERVLFK